MVTRDTPYLTTDTLLDVVLNKDISITVFGMVSIHSSASQWIFNQEMHFLLLQMVMYLLLVG